MAERHGASHSIKATLPGEVPPIPVQRKPLRRFLYDHPARPPRGLHEPGSAGAWGTRNQNPVKAEGSEYWKKRLKNED